LGNVNHFNSMSTTLEIAEQWFQRVWNEKDTQFPLEIMSGDSLGHVEGGEIVGPEQFVQYFQIPLLAAFPDLAVKSDQILADGAHACIRWTATGTHSAEIFGVAPSGSRFEFRGTTWMTVRDGKIVEGWDTWNFHGLLKSLGDRQSLASVKVSNPVASLA
jgi:steroid delta-isomerase-like uncharacterized protein